MVIAVRDLQKDVRSGIFTLRNDAFQRIDELAVLEHIFCLVLARTFGALAIADHQTGFFQDPFGLLPTEVADFPVPVLVHPNGVVRVVAQDQKTLYAGVYGKNGRRFKFGLGTNGNGSVPLRIVLHLVSFPPPCAMQEPEQINDKGDQHQTDFL